MSTHDEQRIAELLRLLTPPPPGWVTAARELPAARAEIDGLVQRANTDAAFRAAVLADIEAALAAEGVEPRQALVELVRRRVTG
jgi:hypothetical protein